MTIATVWKAIQFFAPVFHLKKKVLLVVDDSEDDVALLGRILTRCGYKFDTTDLAETALALFREKHHPVVFVDLALPRMPGWTLAEKIRQESPKTHIVIVTGSHDGLSKLPVGQYFELIVKPVSEESIHDLMQKVRV